MWAKSLLADDGLSLEVDLEHGKSDGQPVLVVPSASLRPAKLALALFVARQNPTLSTSTAARLYTDSVNAFPDIPKTVFTKNIATLLAKRIKKRPAGAPSSGDDGVSEVTPLSSLTGVTSQTSLSKGSLAWKQPVQETL